jgi:chorismate mutase
MVFQSCRAFCFHLLRSRHSAHCLNRTEALVLRNPDKGSEVGVEIEEIRKRIDLLDDVLLRIFNERARLALEIGNLKKGLGLPVFDPAREKRIFARMKEDNPGPLDGGAIVRLFERVVDESRRLERIMSQREGLE